MVKSYVDNAGRPQDALGVFFADGEGQLAAGVYRRAAAVSATAGDGILINATVAGTVTLTLAGGGSISVSVPVGTTILEFAVVAAVNGTATATFQSLFLT